MAEWAPTAQVPESEAEPRGLALMPPPAGPEWTSLSGQTTELSMWTLLAAVQAVESKVDSLTRRVLSLEGGRTSRAEKKKKKKVLEGDEMELEFGNQMESKWAVLGTLVEEYGQLHRRVENMENMLKNQNFWILRFLPGISGEVPKVPATFEGSAAFLQEDWGNLEEGQKELYKQVVKGNYQYLLSLADAMAKPDVLSRMERGEGPCLLRQDGQLGMERKEGLPDASMGSPASAFGLASQVKQEQEPWDEEEEEEEGEERGTEVDGGTAETWLANPKARRHSGGLETHWTKESLDPQEAHGGGGSSPRPEQTLSSQEKVTPGGPEWDRTVPRTPLQGSAEGLCPCGDDSHRFSRKEPLARHRHMGERPYACPTCGKAFIHQSSLTTHHRTHTGEKPYACPTCLKRFTRLSTLLEHQRTHTGEKPYACTECEKRFTRLSTLVEHRRTHTGEKPYQCAQCHKSFTRLTNLTVHQNTHAGERAYSCMQCGRRFPQRACFVKHLRTHTQESPHQCPDCDQGFLGHSWQDSSGQQPQGCGWKERPLQSQPGPPGEWPLIGIQVSTMKTEDVG